MLRMLEPVAVCRECGEVIGRCSVCPTCDARHSTEWRQQRRGRQRPSNRLRRHNPHAPTEHGPTHGWRNPHTRVLRHVS